MTAGRKMLRGEASWDPSFFDYCHPTAQGQEVFAAAILKL